MSDVVPYWSQVTLTLAFALERYVLIVKGKEAAVILNKRKRKLLYSAVIFLGFVPPSLIVAQIGYRMAHGVRLRCLQKIHWICWRPHPLTDLKHNIYQLCSKRSSLQWLFRKIHLVLEKSLTLGSLEQGKIVFYLFFSPIRLKHELHTFKHKIFETLFLNRIFASK